MKISFTFLYACMLLFFVACSDSDKSGDTTTDNNESTSSSDPSDGRYSMKSGIVTSKTTTTMMGSDMTTVLYFDDHGKKSLTETISKISMMGQNMETHTKSLLVGDMMYTWQVGQTSGTKIKIEGMMDEVEMDFKNMSKEMMDKWKIKKTGTETVSGKKCDVYSMDAEGMKGTYYIWDNITMKAETTMSGMNVNVEVTDIKENASIPSSTFDVPPDITFMEATAGGSM